MWTDWYPEDDVEPMETDHGYLYPEDDVEPTETDHTSWYCYTEEGTCHRFEDLRPQLISESDLERFYSLNPRGILEITTAAGWFKFNFGENLLRCMRSGETVMIRRRYERENVPRSMEPPEPTPPYWERMKVNEVYEAFNVLQTSREYWEVQKYVKFTGLLQVNIKGIYRVQNPDLWQLYCGKKQQMMRIRRTDIEEQMLFHGTGRDNLHNICTYNFNCRLSDQTRGAHFYGKGAYFAKHAAYADNYSKQHQGWNPTRFMFLSRVLVGRSTQGRPELCNPDGDLYESLHESCVDDVLHPKIYVIFNSDQIYPEYVLEY